MKKKERKELETRKKKERDWGEFGNDEFGRERAGVTELTKSEGRKRGN